MSQKIKVVVCLLVKVESDASLVFPCHRNLTMNMQSIEKDLLKIIDAFENQLPSAQLADMRDLTKAGEPGVAFENLCTQLYEYSIHVSPERLGDISVLGSAMTIKPAFWERL